jgi:hypothetical protein
MTLARTGLGFAATIFAIGAGVTNSVPLGLAAVAMAILYIGDVLEGFNDGD